MCSCAFERENLQDHVYTQPLQHCEEWEFTEWNTQRMHIHSLYTHLALCVCVCACVCVCVSIGSALCMRRSQLHNGLWRSFIALLHHKTNAVQFQSVRLPLLSQHSLTKQFQDAAHTGLSWYDSRTTWLQSLENLSEKGRHKWVHFSPSFFLSTCIYLN